MNEEVRQKLEAFEAKARSNAIKKAQDELGDFESKKGKEAAYAAQSNPCRETVQMILQKRVERLKAKIVGYEALLTFLGEERGPAEEVIWELLVSQRFHD